MEKLKAKLKKQGGFTMVELLIVVAIIAILVAVSIPMMNNALEKSREAVDRANYRDAIALASVKYITDPKAATEKTWTYYVDSKYQGSLKDTDPGTSSDFKAVTPECTCNDGTNGVALQINIAEPDPGEDTPKIETSWTIGADGKTDQTSGFAVKTT